jgi:hypothetical protein
VQQSLGAVVSLVLAENAVQQLARCDVLAQMYFGSSKGLRERVASITLVVRGDGTHVFEVCHSLHEMA